MKAILLAAVASVALLAAPAHATQITAFGQTSQANTITATANGTGTQTTITTNGTGASVLIDQLFGVVTPPAIAGFFSLTATSIDAAQTALGAIIQHYAGSFSLTSGAGGTGTNELSGTFSDAAFGVNGGTQLSVNVANPPDTLSLSSSVIPAADLVAPSSFTLSMSNLGALSLDNATIAAFTSSFSGVANATTVAAVPEPASFGLLAVGMLGIRLFARRRVV
jgi:hypothetical protein